MLPLILNYTLNALKNMLSFPFACILYICSRYNMREKPKLPPFLFEQKTLNLILEHSSKFLSNSKDL